MIAEQADDVLALALAQQAVVDEDAGELLTNGFVDQHGSHGRIDAAGEAADHAALADLFANLRDGLVAETLHGPFAVARSEEHTSELQSLMRISYAVFCLKKKKKNKTQHQFNNRHI